MFRYRATSSFSVRDSRLATRDSRLLRAYLEVLGRGDFDLAGREHKKLLQSR
jgi:hypothetical protein